MKEKQTAGRRQLEEFAPEFARYNDDILFGEVSTKVFGFFFNQVVCFLNLEFYVFCFI